MPLFARRRTVSLLLVAAALAGLALAESATFPSAAEVELNDQLGGSDSVAAHRGRVTVVMVVTASRLRNLKAWQRDLQDRFEGIDFVLIGDVPPAPAVTHEQVVKKLAVRVPSQVPVLIDLERRWARELDLDTGRPNILLFSRDGGLIDRFRGRHAPMLLEEVVFGIEGLLGE